MVSGGLVKRRNRSGYLAGLLRTEYAALVSLLLSESAAQKAILLPMRLKVPENKVLTEVMLPLYHSTLGTVRSLIALQCISLLR